jgi:hypothetical protein
VFGDVAGSAFCGIAVVNFGAVPGEEVLVRVYRSAEGTPVIPVFLQSVYYARFFMPSITEF